MALLGFMILMAVLFIIILVALILAMMFTERSPPKENKRVRQDLKNIKRQIEEE